MKTISLIALAGAFGTAARFCLFGLVQHFAGPQFPWGTWVVNLIGSMLFGFVWTLADDRILVGDEKRLIILAGFMGAFTTFSTLAFETIRLLQEAKYFLAGIHLVGQNVFGVACMIMGMALGRSL